MSHLNGGGDRCDPRQIIAERRMKLLPIGGIVSIIEHKSNSKAKMPLAPKLNVIKQVISQSL